MDIHIWSDSNRTAIMTEHKPGIIILVIFSLVVFIATLFLSFVSNFEANLVPDDWFLSDIGERSDQFDVTITPSDWTFLIWPVIYVAQFVWFIYGLTTLCRKTKDKQGYLYYRPGHMPWTLYIFFSLANIFSVVWVFVFDREMLELSAVFLWLTALMLYVTIGLSYANLYKHGRELIMLDQQSEIGLVRALVQNALSLYATWVTVASNLGMAILMVYRLNVDKDISSTIILGALACQILLYYILDWTVMDRFSRYTFTPYLVLILALSGSIDKNWQEGALNSVFSAVLLGVAVIGFLIKIIVVITKLRNDKEPILRRKGWQ